MKLDSPLAVVTASIDPERTREFWGTWAPLATGKVFFVHIEGVLGPVSAFAAGIDQAISEGASLIACLHDDVQLYERGWDARIVEHFEKHPACTLAGWSGCEGLGAPDIYSAPKELHQLARQGFFSNMLGAESHGRREASARRSACADGFSQIGRSPFLKRAFAYISERGVQHHYYDSWLGALCWRWGGECWYLPEQVHHAGGRTAVLAPEYAEWAAKQGGDAGLWKAAHEAGYEDGRWFLPFRVDP